jgi:hypothetical protein
MPCVVWNLLPPSGPVVLVPHAIEKPAVSRAATPMIVRNISSIIAEHGCRTQIGRCFRAAEQQGVHIKLFVANTAYGNFC